jgi:hypothetical protein
MTKGPLVEVSCIRGAHSTSLPQALGQGLGIAKALTNTVKLLLMC